MLDLSTTFEPLVAVAIEELIKPLFLFIVFCFWLYRQLKEAGGGGEVEAPKAKPVPPPKRVAEPVMMRGEEPMRQAPAVPARPQQDAIRNEVEEFLRRVREQQQGQAPRPQANPPQSKREKPAAPKPAAQKPQKPKQPAKQERMSKPLSTRENPQEDAYAQEPRRSPPERMPQRMGQLREGGVTEHARQLGQDLSQTDERLDAHLHEKFDHKLGKLGGGKSFTSEPVAAASTPADRLFELLSTAQGIEQAIVLNEVLRRPEERW